MTRKDEISLAYKKLGKEGTFYDGMITCSTFSGRLVSKVVWDINRALNREYLERVLSAIPDDFKGNLLEVPIGTGVLTLPLYAHLPRAKITCLDYSEAMLTKARNRATGMGLDSIRFLQGDVGSLVFEDESFDIVLSLNGFHAFPEKDTAYEQTFRVLKKGGVFCGCFYVKDECARTDWWITKVYGPKGFFTPPYETKASLEKRLGNLYTTVEVEVVKSIACFRCIK